MQSQRLSVAANSNQPMSYERQQPQTIFLKDETATLACGQQLAKALQGGMVIFLQGHLGAGKTTLTRGILNGLGFMGRVKSPTYTLVEPYETAALVVYHFDLYRLFDAEEWEDAGFRDYFSEKDVCIIEWPEKAAGQLPSPDWVIALSCEAEGRSLVISPTSARGTTCLSHFVPPATF